jgi:hypothetical protein
VSDTRVSLARALLSALLTFAIDEPPPYRASTSHRAAAELPVDDVPADLIVLDVVPRRP